jgi:hypothetical protein
MEKISRLWETEPAITEVEEMRDKINELVEQVNILIEWNEKQSETINKLHTRTIGLSVMG